jgi:hypothetical protein
MIIGLVGLKGSGKTTVANYLVEHFGFCELCIAAPLKRVASVFGFTDRQLYGTQREKNEVHPNWGVSAREFMQTFGTDVCRNVLPVAFPNMKIGAHGSVWLSMMEHELAAMHPSQRIVVSDVRFENEAQVLSELENVHLVRITRPSSAPFDRFAQHESEQRMASIVTDHTLMNDGTFEHIHQQVDTVLSDLHIQ